ncbi:SIR2 family NAD-dependent protein deacylase [Heyndrickxia camelliae]|uniref:Uncharacterized protein n=1 Tax=Heyndrickxia camelliae TaxID=1707093 RepID=A0A2N3LG30_9BACI|nr:SIR2 family protein [Heyndrickxia camelliae]PKR83612.1 hypothetical protein CWO92_18805 [Heyndrickxia camelliae]
MGKGKIPDQLILDIVNDKVVPFIGAGFSRSFGYLGWMELLKKLSIEIGIKDLRSKDFENGDPLQIAQAFYQFFKEKNKSRTLEKLMNRLELGEENQDLQILIEKAVDKEVEHLLEKHFSQKMLSLVESNNENMVKEDIDKLKKINKIPFHYIVTTNYDKVLENEIYRDKGYGVLHPGKGRELDWNEHDKTILKIHGDKDSDEGIVFTHEQYYKFMHEYGFFRNKLYTLFSTNTILMIGYGFNDINIHHTYFQFIKDYSENLKSHKKLYMLLTDFDKKHKWKSYFPYYKKYLESYNVEVIEYEDLPSFIEDLVHEYEIETSSSDIYRLLNVEGKDLTDPLLSIVNGENLSVIDDIDRQIGLDIIKVITKFFRNPFILTGKPFSLSIDEEGLTHDIAERLFNGVLRIITVHPSCKSKFEYFELIKETLKFASISTTWSTVSWRIREVFKLMEVLEYKPKDVYDLLTGEYLFTIFSQSHPDKYLKAYDAGQFIQRKIPYFPEFYIKSYLAFLKDYIYGNELIDYPSVNDFWVSQIREKLQFNNEIIDMCDVIDLTLSNNREKDFNYHEDDDDIW